MAEAEGEIKGWLYAWLGKRKVAPEYRYVLRFVFCVVHFFFYKNLVYKNIKASNGPKIKNILRTYEGFKS
jgi:hypothetical protein